MILVTFYFFFQVAVSRCNKEFTIDSKEENEKPNKEERAKLLIDWALKDFQPTGPEGFEVIKGQCHLLLYGCGNERSRCGNPATRLVHKRSDIFLIARSGGGIKKALLVSNKN